MKTCVRGLVVSAMVLTICVGLAHSQATSEQEMRDRQQRQQAIQALYKREMASEGKDCADVMQQQPANIGMGKVEEQTASNFDSFFGQLKSLVGPGDNLDRLNEAEATWVIYRKQTCDSIRPLGGPGGTILPYLEASCFIEVTRSRMKTLNGIYETAISR